jgi:hypothetical protein
MAKATNSLVHRGGGANATSGAATERTQWLLLINALKQKCACPPACQIAFDGLTVALESLYNQEYSKHMTPTNNDLD